jgi:hypothetical protein
MSVKEFRALLERWEYRQNDKKYLPLRVGRYAESVQAEDGKFPVTVELVTAFSRSWRDHKIPAWQRLQAVRAVEAYRGLVLGTSEPSLAGMRQVLQRRAEQDRADGLGAAVGTLRPGLRDERHLAGVIDPNEPAAVQQLRRELRLRRKALETERAYAGWVERFMKHGGSEDLRQFGEREIRGLSDAPGRRGPC